MSSKSMGHLPAFRHSHHRPPPASPPPPHPNTTHQRLSISNLINAVDNARITSSPSPSPPSSPSHQHPAHHHINPATSPNIQPPLHRHSTTTPPNASHLSTPSLRYPDPDDLAARRKKIQSEKKRLWRKNLTPDQKVKRQELDAQRKREQRMNMTPEQRSEARRKDAARKAAKRRLQKEQVKLAPTTSYGHQNFDSTDLTSPSDRSQLLTTSPSSSSTPSPSMSSAARRHRHAPIAGLDLASSVRPPPPADFDSAPSKIHHLLN